MLVVHVLPRGEVEVPAARLVAGLDHRERGQAVRVDVTLGLPRAHVLLPELAPVGSASAVVQVLPCVHGENRPG